MSTKKLANLFGVIFVLIGALGFVPGITSDGHLLGIFEVDTVHNLIHLLSGILAFAMAGKAAKKYFQIFGIVYLLVTILGFMQGDNVLGLIGVNGADNILHLVISLLAIWIGFRKEGGSMKPASMPMQSQSQNMNSMNQGGGMGSMGQ